MEAAHLYFEVYPQLHKDSCKLVLSPSYPAASPSLLKTLKGWLTALLLLLLC